MAELLQTPCGLDHLTDILGYFGYLMIASGYSLAGMQRRSGSAPKKKATSFGGRLWLGGLTVTSVGLAGKPIAPR